ncbi:MAG: PIN domain-containing protein [Nitrososphaerales archaeon]
MFSEQREKRGELSFTDSTSIAVMKSHNVTRIGTFDGDFGEIKGVDAIS